MSHNLLRRLTVPATMIVLAACSVGDAFRPVAAPDAAAPDIMAAPDISKSTGGDTTYTVLHVSPSGGTYVFGEHQIKFPANSVCDMAVTNYLEWGRPCTPISSDIDIAVKWWYDVAGHPMVDFSPALRFQPTRKGEVTLYLKDVVAAKAQNPVIGYCVLSGLPCVDESYLDPALATKKDSRGGFVYRIIRHFSGYNVWA